MVLHWVVATSCTDLLKLVLAMLEVGLLVSLSLFLSFSLSLLPSFPHTACLSLGNSLFRPVTTLSRSPMCPSCAPRASDSSPHLRCVLDSHVDVSPQLCIDLALVSGVGAERWRPRPSRTGAGLHGCGGANTTACRGWRGSATHDPPAPRVDQVRPHGPRWRRGSSACLDC